MIKYIWFDDNKDYFLKVEIFKNIRDLYLVNKQLKKSYFVQSFDLNLNSDRLKYSFLSNIDSLNFFVKEYELSSVFDDYFKVV